MADTVSVVFYLLCYLRYLAHSNAAKLVLSFKSQLLDGQFVLKYVKIFFCLSISTLALSFKVKISVKVTTHIYIKHKQYKPQLESLVLDIVVMKHHTHGAIFQRFWWQFLRILSAKSIILRLAYYDWNIWPISNQYSCIITKLTNNSIEHQNTRLLINKKNEESHQKI